MREGKGREKKEEGKRRGKEGWGAALPIYFGLEPPLVRCTAVGIYPRR